MISYIRNKLANALRAIANIVSAGPGNDPGTGNPR